MFQQSLPIFLGSLACLTSIGCSNVQVLRLTSETFSPRSGGGSDFKSGAFDPVHPHR